MGAITSSTSSVSNLVLTHTTKNPGHGVIIYLNYTAGDSTGADWYIEFMDNSMDSTYYYKGIQLSSSWAVSKLTYTLATEGRYRLPLALGQGESKIKMTFSQTGSAIAGLSKAAACVVTYSTHGLATGAKVSIEDITQTDWTVLNGNVYTITKINDNSFSIPVDTSGITLAYDTGDPGTISTGSIVANIAEGY
jgi:hypothetical protein